MCNGRSSSLRCGRSTIDMCPRPGEGRLSRKAGGGRLKAPGLWRPRAACPGSQPRPARKQGWRRAPHGTAAFREACPGTAHGQALGVDDRRVAVGASVAGREVQQGERPGDYPGVQSCGVGHHPQAYVRLRGHVGQEPQLTRHHGGTAYRTADQRLVQGQGHHQGGAGPGQQHSPGQAVIDQPVNLLAAQAGAGDEDAGVCLGPQQARDLAGGKPASAHAASSRAA